MYGWVVCVDSVWEKGWCVNVWMDAVDGWVGGLRVGWWVAGRFMHVRMHVCMCCVHACMCVRFAWTTKAMRWIPALIFCALYISGSDDVWTSICLPVTDLDTECSGLSATQAS